MPTPPNKTSINPDDFFDRRPLRLQHLGESEHVHLVRLCTDYDFSVLQLERKTFSHLSRKLVPTAPEFVLATRDEHTDCWYSITPGFASLRTLNDYTKCHEIDILHMHLFGDEDADYNQFAQNDFF
jgi:hypothetical protein